MQFRLLGPFEVSDCGRPLDLGPRKQRAVLAVLAIDANRVVSLDRLIDELWGGEPPAAATGSLQAYISNLRRVLEPNRRPRKPATVLATQAPGYVLRVDPEAIDAIRFEMAVNEGRRLLSEGRPEAARQRLESGLAEWRGPAVADFMFEPFAQPAAARLEELRLVATEDRIQAELDCGLDTALVPELQALVTAHPLRERVWALLMLAQYRSGRQADALRTYQSARRALGEELGIEPGPLLQRLESDILAQSPSLDWQPPTGGHDRSAQLAPATPSVAADPAPSRPFIGRLPELVRVQAALAEVATARRGRLVWVSGEAGIGKTRLMEEVLALARRRGAVTAWGGSVEGGGTPAYWPWVEVVRALLDSEDRELVGAAVGPAGAVLAQVVPEIKEVTGPLEPPPALDADSSRMRLFETITGLLRHLADNRGLVVVALDDLQWADAVSLQLLGFLASGLRQEPLLVLASYRPAEVDPTHPLTDAFAALARHRAAERVQLTGLTEEDVSALLEATTGSPIPPAVVTTVHSRTEGNPFFVGELARLLQSKHELQPDVVARAVPAGVRDVVRLRLARLPEQTTAALSVAAVMGRTFELAVLERAIDLEPERALELIEAAIVSGLVEEDSESLGRFRFTHDLVREAVAEELSGLRRSRLHARVGEALESLYGQDPGHAVELAHHFFAASSVAAPAKAIRWAIRAADAERGRLAYEPAEGQLRRALELVRRLPGGRERDEHELEVLLQLVSLLAMTKGFAAPETGEVIRRAQALCEQLGKTREIVPILFRLVSFHLVGGNHEAARDVAERLLELAARSRNAPDLVVAGLAAGATAATLGRFGEARAHLEGSLTLSDGLQDEWLISWLPYHPVVACSTFLAWAAWALGDRERAQGLIRESLDIAAQLGHDSTTAHALHFAAWIAVLEHDATAALEPAEAARDFAERKGFPFYQAMNGVLAGWARAKTSDPAGGRDEIVGNLAALATGGARLSRTFFLALLAEAERAAGRLDEALAALDEATVLVEQNGERFYESELHRLRAELVLAATPKRPADAKVEVERAVTIACAQGARAFESRARQDLGRFPPTGS